MLLEAIATGAVLSLGVAISNRFRKPKRLIDIITLKTDVKTTESPLIPKTVWAKMDAVRAAADQTITKYRNTDVQQSINRDLSISIFSTALAVTGALIYPPLSLLSIPGVLYIVMPTFKEIYQTFYEEGRLSVNIIVAITIFTCFLSGYFVVINFAALIFALSRKLMLAIKNDSEDKFISVFRQHPQTVWLLVDEVELEVPFETLKSGDTFVVHAGELIPADGTIIDGIASIDQHILTGEAQPFDKEVGDKVFASTVVISGKICVQAEEAGEETVVAQIGRILNETATYKTKTELQAKSWADQTVMPTLILSGLSLPFLGPLGATALVNAHFGYRMEVIAPIAILTYFRLMTQHGILVKDGPTLEQLSDIDTVVFDKTGTLTLDQPQVGAVHTFANLGENEVLIYAAAAESRQTHPIALAILAEAQARQLQLLDIDEGEYKIGYGLEVAIGLQTIRVGSRRFVELANIALPSKFDEIEESVHEHGHSLVLVCIDDTLIGGIELVPTIRSEAKAVIHKLREDYGIKSILIISGDRDAPTKKLADTLGIDEYFAETLPQDKASIIERLQDAGRAVCYIGDGINDSIAMKTAQVSISLRGASTVAKDVAQIILMDGGLTQIPKLFEISHKYDKTLRHSFQLLVMSTVIGMGSVFLLHFGIVQTLILKQIGTFASLANTLFPIMSQHHTDNLLVNPLDEKS